MVMSYEDLSDERKELIAKGDLPPWFITIGWAMFKDKYLWADTAREQYKVIAATAAKHYPKGMNLDVIFFNLLWRGVLSPSTPVLANMGRGKAMPVSCSSQYIGDSIYDFYDARLEAAVLTQNGFGTSGYFGDIRPRGSAINGGGVASGTMPVMLGFSNDMQLVKQNNSRRGAFAGYLPIMHGDFDEWANKLHHDGDKMNVGWIINDEFIDKLNRKDPEALRRYKKALHVKMVTGKGYFFFVDKVNRARPEAYINNDLYVKSSNLCQEIELFSDENHTFTCVLSNINLTHWDTIKQTNDVYYSTLFLHGVAKEFINIAKGKKGFERTVRFTEKSMALGLGSMGLHSLLQSKGLYADSLEAGYLNITISKHIKEQAERASATLVRLFGEPEWCKGTGKANTHLTALPPTKSTSLIMGGVSEGINPDAGLVFNQSYAGGEIKRVTPVFLHLLKKKGLYNDEVLSEIRDRSGSIQNMPEFSGEEKRLFRTAFELDQRVLIRLAAQRQPFIDQGQSINLFFSGNASEEYVSAVHKMAFNDENIRGLYYVYSTTGVYEQGGECTACQ